MRESKSLVLPITLPGSGLLRCYRAEPKTDMLLRWGELGKGTIAGWMVKTTSPPFIASTRGGDFSG